jgi:two-component system sensor histidine kinase PhcS
MGPKNAHRAEALQAYAEYEKQITADHLKVGCWLVMSLMPLGVILDYFVYPERLRFFFLLRIASVIAAALVLWFLRHPVSRRFYRGVGLVIASIPVAFICWMIAVAPMEKGGPAASPYYAGLNLTLLAIGFIMRWTVDLSLMASAVVFALYLTACFAQGPIPAEQVGLFVNNLYFLTLTSLIVVVGSWLHRDLRVREFMSRYTLDERTRELEQAIARLQEAEAQLIQQEKMASLGVLSAGIIHEINNPLNFAATNLYALRKRLGGVAPEQRKVMEEIIADVEDGLSRVRDIVSDLRTFTHPEAEGLEAVDVAEVVQAALRYLSGERPDAVRVEVEIPEGLAVRGSRNKLVHVLVNLVENSLDALRQKEFREEVPTVRIRGWQEAGRVMLEVWDNGPGIAPEHQRRVFDPFFTTKDVGQGMGLGLSICYRLLQECGASIRVESEPGRFCRFVLEFPLPAPQAGNDTRSVP